MLGEKQHLFARKLKYNKKSYAKNNMYGEKIVPQVIDVLQYKEFNFLQTNRVICGKRNSYEQCHLFEGRAKVRVAIGKV